MGRVRWVQGAPADPRLPAGRAAHIPTAAGGAECGGLPRGGRCAAAASWGALQPQDPEQAQEERRASPGGCWGRVHQGGKKVTWEARSESLYASA